LSHCVAKLGIAIFAVMEDVGGHPRDPLALHLRIHGLLYRHPVLAGLFARAHDTAPASRARIAARLSVIWRSTRERWS